jgi:hypothetical protein
VSASVCRGCGNQIIWGQTKEGKKIPMDPRAPIYQVIEKDLVARIETGMYVSHWATCPDAYKPKGERAWEKPAQRDFSEPKEVV